MVIGEELTERRVRLLLLKHPRQFKETEKGSVRGSTHSTLASATSLGGKQMNSVLLEQQESSPPPRSRLVRPGTLPAYRICSRASATATGRLVSQS